MANPIQERLKTNIGLKDYILVKFLEFFALYFLLLNLSAVSIHFAIWGISIWISSFVILAIVGTLILKIFPKLKYYLWLFIVIPLSIFIVTASDNNYSYAFFISFSLFFSLIIQYQVYAVETLLIKLELSKKMDILVNLSLVYVLYSLQKEFKVEMSLMLLAIYIFGYIMRQTNRKDFRYFKKYIEGEKVKYLPTIFSTSPTRSIEPLIALIIGIFFFIALKFGFIAESIDSTNKNSGVLLLVLIPLFIGYIFLFLNILFRYGYRKLSDFNKD